MSQLIRLSEKKINKFSNKKLNFTKMISPENVIYFYQFCGIYR